MNWIPVTSSNVAAIAHERGNLYVRFKSGGEYEYLGVAKTHFDGLLSAASVGTYLNAYIKKGGYAYRRLK